MTDEDAVARRRNREEASHAQKARSRRIVQAWMRRAYHADSASAADAELTGLAADLDRTF